MIYAVKQRQSYRTRIKLHRLRGKPELCKRVRILLLEHPGISAADVRDRSGSVILEHPAGLVDITA